MNPKYLGVTRMLDYETENIQKLVEERNWKELSEYERIKVIYDFVRDEILFGYNVDDTVPASRVLRDGYGQCNTKGTLFMALLRACEIPCRIHGFTIDKKLQKGAMTGMVYSCLLYTSCKKHLLERQKHQDYSVHRNERDTAGCTDGSGASAGKEGNGDSDVAGNLDAEGISEIQKNAEIPENAEKGKVGTAVKGRRGQMDPRPIGSDPDVVPGPEETVLKYQEVREAYLQLTEEERLIVGLSVFGGYNSKEIGESLTLNPATVRSKRSRALEKMRKSLEKEK